MSLPLMQDDAGTTPLPRQGTRDFINQLRLDIKFRYLPFRAYYRLRSLKYMYFKDPELRLLRFLVDPRRTSFDVGANLGLVTYLLARLSAEVHAFEPNPLPLRILRSVADGNVRVHQMALSDRTGEAELVVPRSGKGWSSNGARINRTAGDQAIIVKVPCACIDDLGYRDIGFIKIDVEGHERQVLLGARQTLARDRPNLLIENEFAHLGEDVHEVFSLLAELDYQGLALIGGTLRPISDFSVRRDQIEAAARGPGTGRYVKNFVFVPR